MRNGVTEVLAGRCIEKGTFDGIRAAGPEDQQRPSRFRRAKRMSWLEDVRLVADAAKGIVGEAKSPNLCQTVHKRHIW